MSHSGLWARLLDGPTKNNQSFQGTKPPMYGGADRSSQVHVQGATGDLEGTEAINDRGQLIGTLNSNSNAAQGRNLGLAVRPEHSVLDMDGRTPSRHPSANRGSQLHVQGATGNLEGTRAVNDRGEFIGTLNNNDDPTKGSNLGLTVRQRHSVLDINGITPTQYLADKPH